MLRPRLVFFVSFIIAGTNGGAFLKKAEAAGLNNAGTAKLLLADLDDNQPDIPLHLQSVLNRNV
ncbi:hypothetical protein A9Q81_26075 [Gammaproteobacteria bacterium 42_54_T18]|nr:hypothetical protein A9Q81_26075 [Gammaproteobacteria bacterium 42_54_T18]